MSMCCLSVVAFLLCYASIQGNPTGLPGEFDPYHTDGGQTTLPSDAFGTDIPTSHTGHPPSTPDEFHPDLDPHLNETQTDGCVEDGKVGEDGAKHVIPEYSIHYCDNAAENDGKVQMKVTRNVPGWKVRVNYKVRAKWIGKHRAVAQIDGYIFLKKGQVEGTIEIPICDDKIKDGSELHTVYLTSIEPRGTLRDSAVRLHVLDDE